MDIAKRAKQIQPSLTLEITARAKQLKAEGKRVVSFAAGEPDFGTPEYITRAAHEALDAGFTKYTPASGTTELKKAVCEKFRTENGLEYSPENIVISNGAKHSLLNALLAIIDEGDEVLIPAPYWLSYPELVKIAGGTPKTVQTLASDGFKLTADALERAVTDKTKAVILNDPNNPTGAVYTKGEIDAIAAVIEKHDIYAISDEIYEKLCYEGEHYSIAAYSQNVKDKTIVVNGMSKTYSMTGWRIGYAAANAKVAKAMASMQSHGTSNPNSIAQYASTVALTDKASGDKFLAEMKSTFDARRRLMTDRLDEYGLSYIKPHGAFYVMLDVSGYFGKTVKTAHEFASKLLDKYCVAVIPCESFGADGYVRLSYAVSPVDIEHGLETIKKFVSELK